MVCCGCGQNNHYKKECPSLTRAGGGAPSQAESQSSVADASLEASKGKDRG